MFKKISYLLLITSLYSCSSVMKKKVDVIDPLKSVVGPKVDLSKFSLQERLEKEYKAIPESETQRLSYFADKLYVKGSDASLRGDSESAALYFEYVLKVNNKDQYVQKRYAVELIRLNKLEEAKMILSSLFETEKSEKVGLILAGVQTALKEKRQAQLVYLSILKDYPSSEEACVFLAKSYSLEAKFQKAFKLLNKCEKNSKGKAIFAFYRGKIEIARGNIKAAEKDFKRSLKIDPSYQQSAIGLGAIYEEDKKFSNALEVYENFLKESPYSYSILKNTIQIYFALGKYEKVIPFAERLSNIDSSDLNLKVRLGILYADSKRYADAKGIFKEILAAVPKSDKVLYYLGTLYQQTGELDSAVSYYSKVPEESSLFHESNIQIAQILQASAIEQDDARSKLVSFVNERADKHMALRVELRVLLAGFYENEGDLQEAVGELEKIKNEKTFNEGHEYYFAALLEKVNRFDKAKEVIEQLLVKNPENPHALNFLGYSLLERGEDLDRAFSLISKAVELKPDDGYIRDSLGWFYYKTGQYEKALVEIKKAWTLVNTDVVITKHLAMIYTKLKNFRKAKEFYVEALKNCKVESERRDVLKELSGLENLRLPASQ
ncbi:tetratricopeptide repeat protein [Halobacteriovorax sp.]|uniref:tetratricopeptide repeat protein n=1 Tax=Halobacteriovorax sp. TaxID=2020862 RepID=UPI0035684608